MEKSGFKNIKSFLTPKYVAQTKVAKKQVAFTLAEVLITLGIIGIVAALTIPTLIQNQQEKQTVVKLKKVYSTLSQAYLMARNEYGSPTEWGIGGLNNADGAKNIYDRLSPYLKISKDCGQNQGCFPDVYYKTLSNVSWMNSDKDSSNLKLHRFMLQDGTSMYIQTRDENCAENFGNTDALSHICAFIAVDINGLSKPNVTGKDLFWFMLSSENIIPRGTQAQTGTTFAGNCKNKNANQWGCAGWVIENENMDYLHCPDELSWDGKHSCKE